jgi:hypothetical protein
MSMETKQMMLAPFAALSSMQNHATLFHYHNWFNSITCSFILFILCIHKHNITILFRFYKEQPWLAKCNEQYIDLLSTYISCKVYYDYSMLEFCTHYTFIIPLLERENIHSHLYRQTSWQLVWRTWSNLQTGYVNHGM